MKFVNLTLNFKTCKKIIYLADLYKICYIDKNYEDYLELGMFA